MSFHLLAPLLIIVSVLPLAADGLKFTGACDASAAVALGDNAFVVADDESNTLRIYRLDTGSSAAVASHPLDAELGVSGWKEPETDIEGATRVGDTIFWITSHGRSRKGKWRDARFFFFATTVPDPLTGEPLELKGRPYNRMIHALVRLPGLELRKAIGELGENEGKNYAPKESGLNIESLSASADGKTIYLGFRNPRPGEKAILLPLENAAEVTGGTGMAPRFGAALLLDLGGFGFRAMEYSPFHQCHFIIGGSHDSGGDSMLFRWDGLPESKPERVVVIKDYNPESIVVFPDQPKLLLLSDDGSELVAAEPGESSDPIENGKCECKSLTDPNRRQFRAFWIEVPKPNG